MLSSKLFHNTVKILAFLKLSWIFRILRVIINPTQWWDFPMGQSCVSYTSINLHITRSRAPNDERVKRTPRNVISWIRRTWIEKRALLYIHPYKNYTNVCEGSLKIWGERRYRWVRKRERVTVKSYSIEWRHTYIGIWHIVGPRI